MKTFSRKTASFLVFDCVPENALKNVFQHLTHTKITNFPILFYMNIK